MATGRIPTTANSPLTVKGDLFGYSTTQARVPVGNDGETLVADSSTSTGLRYGANFAAGKNAIINGDFGVWQRGTSFTNLNGAYAADRFRIDTSGTATTMTTTQQTFTPGTAPVSGYEGKFFFRNTITTVGTMTTCEISQFIEDVRTDAGQTITISFWAKADSARTTTSFVTQMFGSGGSSPVDVNPSGNTFSLTTSWQRFSYTLTMPSISGKTIGTNSYVRIQFRQAVAAGSVFDIWGVQVEVGSVATAFQTATGTIQGELAACQRYYFRQVANAAGNAYVGNGHARNTTTDFVGLLQAPVEMRVVPTSVDYSTLKVTDGASNFPITSLTIGGECNTISFKLNVGVASGLTAYRPGDIAANSSSSAYLGFSAEL
jgi:hypothetical protein